MTKAIRQNATKIRENSVVKEWYSDDGEISIQRKRLPKDHPANNEFDRKLLKDTKCDLIKMCIILRKTFAFSLTDCRDYLRARDLWFCDMKWVRR